MINIFFIFCILFSLQQGYSQDQRNNIVLTDSSVSINNIIVKSGIRSYLFKTNDFKEIFKSEKIKKNRGRKMNVWDYYFLDSGVGIKMYSKKEGLNSIYVFYSNNLSYMGGGLAKMKFFSGNLTLLNVSINNKTTINDIKEKFKNYNITFNPGRVSFNFENVIYELTFEDEQSNAKIVFISIR